MGSSSSLHRVTCMCLMQLKIRSCKNMNMPNRSCSCNCWLIVGFPCAHAVRCIMAHGDNPIDYCGRNVMEVEHLLNYLNENDAVIESPTEEEIIESVMNNENDPDPDDSSVVPNMSSKDAFQAMAT
ncbi:uncharacterized protein LOC113283810 [Papaver somniferum]|uniref:uncharacterized protein LOC113283810 n=1 Tax=Papaver somniferum TaxID=3469 RepID=UPI000E702C6D|nr:uncharacterized protein LOC113283810 [Papaver somniferum]